jgi:hypothetical protein
VKTPIANHPLRRQALELLAEILADALDLPCSIDQLELVAVDDGRVVSLHDGRPVSLNQGVYALVDAYNQLAYQRLRITRPNGAIA